MINKMPDWEIELQDYDLVVVNSSGGKDSLCALWEVCRLASAQGYPRERVIVSHQDLGEMEWKGTRELVERQCEVFGVKVRVSKRRDKGGYEESLLEYVERRKKWPSNKQRYCTSDFKRGPGARVVTELSKGMGECRILHVFGFRAEESPARGKKEVYKENVQLSTRKRKVYDWLPIHDWTGERVWRTIRENNLPYHPAYDMGMPRLSCVFCIFSPFDALVVAGKANPELLDRYIATEEKIGHSFRSGFAIASVKEAIDGGYEPKNISNWIM